MKRPLRALVLAALLLMGLPVHAAATAELDRDQVQPGDTVQLNLQRDGSGNAEPDLAPLRRDFDVLGSSRGSSIEIINGSISRHQSVRVTLSPKHAGTLSIPPLAWGGERTQALQLTVGNGGGAQTQGQAAASPHVFITSTLDEQRPYVQSSLLLTVQLHTDLPLQQASLDFNGTSDVLVQQVGKDQQSRETRNGHGFDVIERQYLLQPQRSGKFELDGPTLDAEVADRTGGGPFGNDPFFSGMLGATRPIRVHGDPISLDVRPRPAAAQGSDWLPARSLNLVQTLSADPQQLHAGDPLTLHLHLRAAGLSGAQLPDLSSKLRLPDGVKAYPDQAKLDTTVDNGEVVGTRNQDIALIAGRAGRYQLPELHLPWWDRKADVQREIVLPAMTLEVAAAGGAAGSPLPAAADNANAEHRPAVGPAAGDAGASRQLPLSARLPSRDAWPWISLAFALLWLASLCAWALHVRALRRTVRPDSASAGRRAKRPDARKAFLQACRRHDAIDAQRELLNWARQSDPAQAASGLSAIAQRLGDARIAELLQELDRACYAGADWNGEALAAALDSLDAPRKNRKAKSSELAPLYP
ncbi:BatD family protein [Solimonas terrae]|uniref:Protein BatD n=1 Tax=Solimonas terrae TaxID=1396819 RepID=A0A6M2BW63_9GAMM|nr:BatD family protein [Solimonas terrae]NGY06816.1 protein BatD [Solimonas terrae]